MTGCSRATSAPRTSLLPRSHRGWRRSAEAVSSVSTAWLAAAVVSVERDAHLAAAAYLMRRAGETALVVVDTNQSTPLAIITDTDVAQAIADGHDPNKVRLSDLV